MSNKDKDLMGYDPLEWLKEESASASPEAPDEQAPDTATTPPQAVQAEEAVVIEEAVAEAVVDEPAETPEVTSTDPVLDFETSLQIMDVALLKPRLEESLAQLKEITLRADQDIVIDGAGIQLLLAFVKQAQTNGVKLQWEMLPPPIAEAAKLLNAEQIMLND